MTIDRDWQKKQRDLTASDHAPVVAELTFGIPVPMNTTFTCVE